MVRSWPARWALPTSWSARLLRRLTKKLTMDWKMKARMRAKTILGTPSWTKLVRSALPGLFDVLEETLVVCDVGGEVRVGCKKRHGVVVLRKLKQSNRRIKERFGGGMQGEGGCGVRFPDGAVGAMWKVGSTLVVGNMSRIWWVDERETKPWRNDMDPMGRVRCVLLRWRAEKAGGERELRGAEPGAAD